LEAKNHRFTAAASSTGHFLPIITKMEAAKTVERPPKFRRAERRHDQKQCLWRILGAVLATIVLFIPGSTLWSSDFYLSHLGPAPLRFAAVPAKPGDFVWPISLNPARAVTNVLADTSSASTTNSAISLASSSVNQSQTNGVSSIPAREAAASTPLIGASTPNGLDGNPLSASNLLVVTPQMLADFFKANLDSSMRLSTNAPSGADVPFNPPIPKPTPSSEAIYRTQ
jgi:hypothetical protein